MSDNKKVTLEFVGDASKLAQAVEESRKRVKGFADQAAFAAAQLATSYAALKGVIINSIEGFYEAERASRQLEAALQQQGMFSDELVARYGRLADQMTELTGIDDDAATAIFARTQAYLGQIPITERLTTAAANLAAATGVSLEEAFQKITLSLAGSRNQLATYGIEIDKNASKQERLNQILEGIEGRFNGQAEAARSGDVSFKRLSVEVGNLGETMGSLLAPAAEAVADAIRGVIKAVNDHPAIAKTVAVVVALSAAIVGLITGISALATGFGIFQGALAIVLPILKAVFGAIVAFAVANPISAIIIAVVALGAAFATYFFGAEGAVRRFVNFFTEAGAVIRDLIVGFFSADSSKIDGAIERWKAAMARGFTDIEAQAEASGKKQNDALARAAAEREAAARAHADRMKQIKTLEVEIMKLEADRGSKDLIELKKQELQLIRQIDEEDDVQKRSLLQRRREENVARQKEEAQLDAEQRRIINEEILAQNAEFNALSAEERQRVRAQILAEMASDAETERSTRALIVQERAKEDLKSRNQRLKDQQEFGKAYAAINQALHSKEAQGVNQATQELVALTQSKNSTLKSIGKAAAIAQIAIQTATAAMNIYAGFSAIPIIGPALGIAGAAAAIAFGAERIGQVTAAADGGLITGGIRGRDSVPALLMPGELVVPERNFDEVVGAVRGNRSVDNREVVEVLRRIEGRLEQPSQTIIQGDVIGDDSFIDTLVTKISYALEFRNARIVGVNS